MLGTSIKIRDIAIHPNRPIIAVAFDKKIRLYYIMFNEFKVLKDINCSLIKELVFNNSGSMLAAIMRGKNGTKVYLYRVNEI